MEIKLYDGNRRNYIDLLLIADEEEAALSKYIEEGDMFLLYENKEVKAGCIVIPINQDTCELKNIAVYPNAQNHGYGKKMILYLFDYYKCRYQRMIVGTGDSQRTIGFYEHIGFHKYKVINNFFINNYQNPIYDDGKQLKDMIYLEIELAV